MTDQKLQQMFELTDRLLAPYHNGIAEGEQRERERIIKLLEFELWEAFQKSHNEQPAWATMGMLVRAIKGENK